MVRTGTVSMQLISIVMIILMIIVGALFTAMAMRHDGIPTPGPVNAARLQAATFPQTVSRPDATVTLRRAVAFDTYTRLEFVLTELPFERSPSSDLVLLTPFIPNRTARLEGFTDERVLSRRTTSRRGEAHIIVDLPPLKRTDRPATVEITTLRIFDAERGESHTLRGPWSYDFVPCLATHRLLRVRSRLPGMC